MDKMYSKFMQLRREKKGKNLKAFVVLKFVSNLRRQIRYFGRTIENCHEAKARFSFFFATMALTRDLRKKVGHIIFYVLRKSWQMLKNFESATLTYFRIVSIQKMFLMALSKKEARIEILNLYWDKLCHKILCHAVLIKDTKMSALIKKLKKVQPNIRKALFEFYI